MRLSAPFFLGGPAALGLVVALSSSACSGSNAGLGFADVASYVSARRQAGWTWLAMAAEAGQPQTWLRRHS